MDKNNMKPDKSNIIIVLIAIGTAVIILIYSAFAQKLAWPLFPLFNSDNSGKHNITDDNNDPDNNDNSYNNSNRNSNNGRNTGRKPGNNTGSNIKTSAWDIGFSSAKIVEIVGGAKEISPVTYNDNSASFNITLASPGDKILYNFTIKNKGQIDAVATSIYIIPDNDSSNPILFNVSGIDIGDELKAGKSVDIEILARYNPDFIGSADGHTETIKVIINYSQK